MGFPTPVPFCGEKLETVDVIIPVRGHAKYLGGAIDSIFDSSGDIEPHVIVVSDADRAAYDVAAKRMSGGNMTAVLLEEHSGAYIAINTGLRERLSTWVTFCGADDMFEPQRLEWMVGASADAGEMAIANTWHTKMDEAGRRLKLSSETLGGVFMYHHKMIDALGGFRPWPCSADTEFYHRAIIRGGQRRIRSKPAYLYRKHKDQLTSREATRFGSDVRRRYESDMMEPKQVYVEPVFGRVIERVSNVG